MGEGDLGTLLLVMAGVLGVIVACVHGYLGETRIIARSSFPSRQAKGLVRAEAMAEFDRNRHG